MEKSYYFFYRLLIFVVGLGFALGGIQFQLGRTWALSVLVMIVYTIALQPLWKNVLNISNKFGGFVNIPFFYFLILFAVNLLNQSQYATPLANITLLEDFLFFLLLLVHVNYDSYCMRFFMRGFAIGGLILSILAVLGIGMEIEIASQRMMLFGQNPNDTSVFFAIGTIVILVDIILRDKFKIGFLRYLFFLSFLPIISCMVLLGSRTGIIVVAAMLIAVILLYPVKSRFKKVIVVFSLLSTLAYFSIDFLSSDNILANRMNSSVEKGDLSGRDDMWEKLVPFVIENPIFGYGETGYVEISRKAFGEIRVFGDYTYGFSPHNVIMELLIYTGVIGLIIWLFFWFRITIFAWKNFMTSKEYLPIVFILPLTASILTAQILTSLWSYFVYAFILAEYKISQNEQKTQGLKQN